MNLNDLKQLKMLRNDLNDINDLKVDSEHPGASEKPRLSTIVEVALLLLLKCIRLQRLGDIPNYLMRHTKPIFATQTAPMGPKIGVEGSILACPDSVPASKMQV